MQLVRRASLVMKTLVAHLFIAAISAFLLFFLSFFLIGRVAISSRLSEPSSRSPGLVGSTVMFLWSFRNGLQQKQSSSSSVASTQSASLGLPTGSLLLSKSSYDFPGLSASPSGGLNLLLQISTPPNGIFSSASIHHVHSRCGWSVTYYGSVHS